MAETVNTTEGLAHLARIVAEARGGRKVREFARIADLSHATISRIESQDIASPSDRTFFRLAKVCRRSFEELKAIARSEKLPQTKQVHIAEDLIPLVDQLTNAEAVRLVQIIVARLARMDASISTTTKPSGLNLEINLMTPQQLGAILKAIGDRLEDSQGDQL